MSNKDIEQVMGGMGWLCVGITLLFCLFLWLGGRTMDFNGLSNDMDTSVIGEAEPVQLYVEGLE